MDPAIKLAERILKHNSAKRILGHGRCLRRKYSKKIHFAPFKAKSFLKNIITVILALFWTLSTQNYVNNNSWLRQFLVLFLNFKKLKSQLIEKFSIYRRTARRTRFHETLVLRIVPATLNIILTSNLLLTNDTLSSWHILSIYWEYSNGLSKT